MNRLTAGFKFCIESCSWFKSSNCSNQWSSNEAFHLISVLLEHKRALLLLHVTCNNKGGTATHALIPGERSIKRNQGDQTVSYTAPQVHSPVLHPSPSLPAMQLKLSQEAFLPLCKTPWSCGIPPTPQYRLISAVLPHFLHCALFSVPPGIVPQHPVYLSSSSALSQPAEKQ